MRLAVIDPHGNVILAWPTTAEAHADIGEKLAARTHPRRWQRRKRERLARELVEHIVELQRETVRL